MKLAVIGTGWIVKSFIDGLKFAPDLNSSPYIRVRASAERHSQRKTG